MSSSVAEPSDYQAVSKRLEREVARLRRENAELKAAVRHLAEAATVVVGAAVVEIEGGRHETRPG